MTKGKNATLVAWHNSSSNSMEPLYPALKKRGFNPTLFTFGPADDYFEKKNIPHTSLTQYGFREGLDYESSVDILRKALRNSNPDIVIVGTSPPGRGVDYAPEQLAIGAARDIGAPSISAIDYHFVQDRYDNRVTGEELFFRPNVVAALDDINRQKLLESGFKKSEIVVTGNPQYDTQIFPYKAGFNEERKREIKLGLGILESHLDSYLVVNVGSIKSDMEDKMAGFWDEDCVRTLFIGLSQLPEKTRDNLFVRVNRHPGEKSDEAWNIVVRTAEKYANFAYIARSQDEDTIKLDSPLEMALSADLLVAPRSNMLRDATMLGIDCLSMQPGIQGEDPLITNALDLTPRIYHESDADLVTRIVQNPNETLRPYRERRQTAGLEADGKATERVVNLAENLTL